MKEGGRTTGGAALAAAAHGAPARSAKLPPSPSTTLCLPQQQRARQRAAEKAIVDQDAAILQRLLGGPPAPPTDSQVQPQAQPQPQQEASPRILQPAPPPPAALEGCLSSVTLQSLMPSAQPSQQQQQSPLAVQASCSWSGGGPLAAEPSALTAYITRLEEHSSLMERQLTHLQASTSGGSAADRTPFPAPLRSARHPLAPGRREVFVLSKWLEVRPWGSLAAKGGWCGCRGASRVPAGLRPAAGRQKPLTHHLSPTTPLAPAPPRTAPLRPRRSASTPPLHARTSARRWSTSCCWRPPRRGSCTGRRMLSWRARWVRGRVGEAEGGGQSRLQRMAANGGDSAGWGFHVRRR